MSSFVDLLHKISGSLPRIPMRWTSVWIYDDGVEDTRTTDGEVWATELVTFRDKRMFGGPRTFKDLTSSEFVTDVYMEWGLRGPRLRVFTRFNG